MGRDFEEGSRGRGGFRGGSGGSRGAPRGRGGPPRGGRGGGGRGGPRTSVIPHRFKGIFVSKGA